MTITGDLKHDGGKAPVARGFSRYFPRAIEAVSLVSLFGFEKYKAWGGWKKVDDAYNRYDDALGRHDLALQRGETHCPESMKLHLAHRAWNAFATLELYLIEEEAKRGEASLEQERMDKSWADAAAASVAARTIEPLPDAPAEPPKIITELTPLEKTLYSQTPIETCKSCKTQYDCQRVGVCFHPPKFTTCGKCDDISECAGAGRCFGR